nr:unnamed protein product [Callosobruchus analis]
MSASDSSIFR